jgi:phytoene dehydrogenase-like protein
MVIGNKKFASGKYDVVVVGAGLGGLTAANVLAKRGRKVLLVEQHFQIGGLATSFRRKQHIFDVALHGFPVGMKKTLRKYWSKEMAERIVQVPSIRFDNPQFSLDTPFTKEHFIETLVTNFKLARSVVDAFFAELDSMNYYDDRSMTNRELFEKYFPGRNDVVRLLMEPITYANGSTLDEPAITYGIVFSNFMSKGVYTFRGGTDLMLDMMTRELRGNGVEIKTTALLEKVELDAKGKVAAAVIDGQSVQCQAVLSNGNIISTIRGWVGLERFSKEFAGKVEAIRLNNSSCQVYFGLKPDAEVDPMGDLLFTSTHPVFEPEAILSKNVTSRTYSLYYPSIRPEREPDHTIVASMNANFEDWRKLEGKEYDTAKKRLADATLADLAGRIPGIEDKLDHVEVATPKTFQRYTLHGGGASFGTKFEGLEVSLGLPKEIPGMFHAGSVGIIMSGWLGAANYGVITANNVDTYLDA